MAGKASKPSFFWQGLLIILPVAALALGSLASLRWDEQSVERDARQKAAQSVQSLAEVIRSSVNEDVQLFNDIQYDWTTEQLYDLSEPGMTVGPDHQLMAKIEAWKRDYPAFRVADLATRRCDIRNDGRLVDPPDIPVAPLPPKWYCELSAEQRDLWQTLRRKMDDNEDYRAAYKAFVTNGVSADARQAAENLEQRLKLGALKANFPLSMATEHSESGISFSGIALERMLRNPAVHLSLRSRQALWREIIVEPSFIAPELLQMAEARTNGADPQTCDQLHRTRQLWELQLKERAWLESLRYAPELKQKWKEQSLWCRWVSGPAGEALAFGGPYEDDSKVTVPEDIHGQEINFVPGQVIDAIFDRALKKNEFLVPNFADVGLTVEGKTFKAPHRVGNGEPELLGTASGSFGGPITAGVAGFEVKFFLTSKEQMLSMERQRARLFGLLILGAVAGALIGFISAWRAFRTQLQLSEAKSNFVSSVSHELRAPIASVRLMAESLERGKVNEAQKQNEYFQFIVQECRRLSSLIENVLDFSRIEQGRKQYELEPTDVAALVRETVKLMEPYAAEKGVLLETSNIQSPISNIELEVDGRAMQQALVNLIDNAIKHSAKGQTVTVGLDGGGKANSETGRMPVLLYVEDHGAGIPPEEQEKIFERFYRLGSELRRETQGVGIGLSIVKHIVVAHGGKVTVRSNVGQGSRFTIELPEVNAKAQRSGGAKDS